MKKVVLWVLISMGIINTKAHVACEKWELKKGESTNCQISSTTYDKAVKSLTFSGSKGGNLTISSLTAVSPFTLGKTSLDTDLEITVNSSASKGTSIKESNSKVATFTLTMSSNPNKDLKNSLCLLYESVIFADNSIFMPSIQLGVKCPEITLLADDGTPETGDGKEEPDPDVDPDPDDGDEGEDGGGKGDTGGDEQEEGNTDPQPGENTETEDNKPSTGDNTNNNSGSSSTTNPPLDSDTSYGQDCQGEECDPNTGSFIPYVVLASGATLGLIILYTIRRKAKFYNI